MSNSLSQDEQDRLDAVLAEFSRWAGELYSPDEVCREFDRALSELIDYDRIVISFGNPESGTVTGTFVSEVSGSEQDPLADQSWSGAIGTATAFFDKPVVIPDCTDPSTIERFPFLKESSQRLRSLASVPLKRHGSTVGSILVFASKKDAFSKKDVEKLQVAAAHVTPSVTNSLQLKQFEKEVHERTVLADISRLVSSTIDFELVWDQFAETVKGLMPCDRLVMAIQGPDGVWTKDKYRWGVTLPNWDEAPDRMAIGEPAQSILEARKARKARIIPTEESDKHSLKRVGYRISEKTGLNSSMIAPLIAGNQVIGTLNIKALEADAYSADNLAMFELLAMQIGGSVGASELYSRTLKHAEETAAKAELALKNKYLVETNETRSRFIAAITHELRTPLTSIIAAADRLFAKSEDKADSGDARYLEMISRNTKRLHELIENLLVLSDIEQDELWLSGGEFTLYGAVKDAISSIKPIADIKYQRLATEFPGMETVIKADRGRLVQIMENLLSNACKYSPDYKEVKLKVAIKEGHVEISVIDQGDGISEEDIPLIFDEFSRLDNAVTKANTGRGLGLSISRKLARAMGGDIQATSEPGKGSIFTLKFPMEIVAAA